MVIIQSRPFFLSKRMEKQIQRQKELALLQTPLTAPSDDEEYEVFYRKHIEPIEVERYQQKKKAIKNYCKKKNRKLPTFHIDTLADKIEVLTDDSDKEEIEHLGMEVHPPALKDSEIETYQKGRQIVLFSFEGTASNLSDFPMAIEGDFIIKQSFELTGGEWKDLEYFSKHPNRSLITCYILPKGLTGNFRVVYGKYYAISRSPSLRSDKGFQESCENIAASLKEIDRKEKEQEFIKTNFKQSTTYRVPISALQK